MAIDKNPLNTLTVAQLRDLLEGADQDALVVFRSDYGDYYHTQQVHPFTQHDMLEGIRIDKSGYSHSGFAMVSEDDNDECEVCGRHTAECDADQSASDGPCERGPRYVVLG